MDNYNYVKDEACIVMIQTKKVIDEFQETIKQKKDEIPKIDEIKKELRKITKQLDDIKKVMDEIDKLYVKLGVFILEQQEKLKNSSLVLLKQQKAQLISLMNENLPDDMSIIEIAKNAYKIIISCTIEEHDKTVKGKNIDKIKSINNLRELIVGEISVVDSENELIFRIKMKDENNYQEFKIDNSLKIYPIISHIINRYYYKDEVYIK